MARKRTKSKETQGDLLEQVQDYRHESSKRSNNPPAKLAAEGTVPVIPKARYYYSPHRPPELRFDPTGAPDALPELIEAAKQRALTDEEAQTLGEALREHEPWLEWATKREQHEQGWFDVDPVALHIHERASAQAILRVAAREDAQRDLFADPQLEYHEAVQFYRHDVDWANRMILGDSLQVMSSLARREDLAGKVQMIYIDPPYGIKFSSNFQPEVGRRDVKDKDADLTREPEMVKAYRDTWHLGIHSYLSYLRDRLIVARELLADTGSIFVQINDENLHRVRQILDEVFGVQNAFSIIAFTKTGGFSGKLLDSVADYLLWYAKDKRIAKYRQITLRKAPGEEGGSKYSSVALSDAQTRPLSEEERSDLSKLPETGKVFRIDNVIAQGYVESSSVPFSFQGTDFGIPSNSHWKTNPDGMTRLARSGRLCRTSNTLGYVRFLDDFPIFALNNVWTDIGGIQSRADPKVYAVQTATKVIERCLLMTTDPGDLVLDPTCGSGTTAYVAEQWGRRWITMDTSRVAIALARQRLMTAKFDMYKVVKAASSSLQPGRMVKTRDERRDEDVAFTGMDADSGSGYQGRGEDAAFTGMDADSGSVYKGRGEDAAFTGEGVFSTWFDPGQPVGHVRGGNLPHWRQEGVTYFVTWRTVDSMPKERVRRWVEERDAWVARHREPWDVQTKAEYDRLFSARWEQWLDEAHGACVLRTGEVQQIVVEALRHFDHERYVLGGAVVAPNHVHVLVQPLGEHALTDIVKNWKSYTAHAINELLGRKGVFWQKESFDHIVRNADEFVRIQEYMRDHREGGMVEATSSSLQLGLAVKGRDERRDEDAAFTGRNVDSGLECQGRGEDAAFTGRNADSGSGYQGRDEDVAFTGTDMDWGFVCERRDEDVAFTGMDPHPGFVYKTVPHVTLKSIAQNQNLDPIFEKHQPILDRALEACNAALKEVNSEIRRKLRAKLAVKQREEGKRAVTDGDRRRWDLPKERFEHWTVPFDTDADWPKALQKAVTAYREAWRAKMDEVNACIAANADQEELVDQPEVVKGVTRVSGPFTVEAVQPPEMSLSDVVAEIDGGFGGAPEELETGLGDDEYDRPPMVVRRVEARPDMDVKNIEAYLEQMTRLLRTDGVRFPNNKEMVFSRLDRLTGVASFLHAEGRWVPKGEEDPDPEGPAEVVVAFGPQYGPITAKQVEECNRSAFRRGYTDLVFAGFSFDGPAQTAIEEIHRENPKMRIHLAHIRPDVNPAMDGLLKEQPGSQLFTVFGQPRTTVEGPDKEGMYTVAMEGVDIYDPVTNEIRATGADKVAAWFLDSDYDGRVFCITQAFFPDKSAWKKLARSLKGVLDEDAFAAFSGTESLPFPLGEHRRVAVKVIDPRGNEVMNVHELE